MASKTLPKMRRSLAALLLLGAARAQIIIDTTFQLIK
jgi:hypothetical protein